MPIRVKDWVYFFHLFCTKIDGLNRSFAGNGRKLLLGPIPPLIIELSIVTELVQVLSGQSLCLYRIIIDPSLLTRSGTGLKQMPGRSRSDFELREGCCQIMKRCRVFMQIFITFKLICFNILQIRFLMTASITKSSCVCLLL